MRSEQLERWEEGDRLQARGRSGPLGWGEGDYEGWSGKGGLLRNMGGKMP